MAPPGIHECAVVPQRLGNGAHRGGPKGAATAFQVSNIKANVLNILANIKFSIQVSQVLGFAFQVS